MKIKAIKTASDLYVVATDFNRAYRKFRRATRPELDLTRSDHREALLSWLRRWGCRQFKVSDLPLASQNILSWHETWAARLPERELHLCDLCQRPLEDLALAYDALRHETASYQERRTGRVRKRVGPTGASKILFALRPRIAVAWDGAMQADFGYKNGSAYGYQAFLVHVQDDLADLARQCRGLGFPLRDLPNQLGRPDATVPQLAGEYYWLRTRGQEV